MIPRVQEMRVAREGGLAPGWRPLAPTPQQQACRRSKRKRGGFPARYGRRSGAFGAGRAGRSYEAGSPRRRRLGRTTESQMGSDCRCWSRRLRWPARAGCDAHGSTSIRSAARTLEAAVARVRRREGAPWGAAEGAEYLTTIRAPSPHIGAGAGCGQDAPLEFRPSCTPTMTSPASADGAPDPRTSLRPSEHPAASAPEHSFMPNGCAGSRRQVERRTLRRSRTRAPRAVGTPPSVLTARLRPW